MKSEELPYGMNDRERVEVRAHVPAVIADARRRLELAETALRCPDPEAALAYLLKAHKGIAAELRRYRKHTKAPRPTAAGRTP